MGSFTHLQRDQLCKISALTAEGVSAGHIARSIGVHRSTIYGEWNRCGGRAHYCEDAAEFDRLMKRAAGADNARRYDKAIWASVQRQLDAAWSPRMIDARSRAFARASAHTDVGAGARAATPGLPETRGSGVMPSASRIYAWAQTQPHAWWTGKRIRRYGPRKLRVTLGNNGVKRAR